MDKARAAVSDFVSQGGKHKTTVDESVAPAVTDHHIKPHRHENVTTAIDREVHQDHHHTTVQPIKHREVLPEQHSHNMVPVEHRSFEHGNERDVKDRLAQEAARFKNTSTTHDHTSSTATAPTVEGERVHHHVHEHVQPVINKETIAPKVVHTTVPIHETHHAAAEHHGMSTLPVKTLDEFKSAGGIIDGKGATHHGEYDGCPRPYNKSLQTEATEADRDMHHHSHGVGHSHTDGNTTGTTGSMGSGMGSGMGSTGRNNLENDIDGRGTRGTTGTTGMGSTGNDMSGLDNTTSNASATGKKPSLMDKLNPKVDSNGDGKAGFMK